MRPNAVLRWLQVGPLLLMVCFLPFAKAALYPTSKAVRECWDELLGNHDTPRAPVPAEYKVLPWTLYHERPPGTVQIDLPFDSMDHELWNESLKQGGREVGRWMAYTREGHLIQASDFVVGVRDSIPYDLVKESCFTLLEDMIQSLKFLAISRLHFSHTHPNSYITREQHRYIFGIPTQLSPGDLMAIAIPRKAIDDKMIAGIKIFLEISSITVMPPRPWRRQPLPVKSSVLFLPKPH